MTAVYVIAAEGGPVKVGIAGNPRRRLSTLRTASAVRLDLMFSAEASDSARLVERRAHDIMAADRKAGEWFEVASEQAIAALKQAAAEIGCELAPLSGPEDTSGSSTPALLSLVESRTAAAQCRAARALLKWSQSDLSHAAKIGRPTLAEFEAERRTLYRRTFDSLRLTFKTAGVLLIEPENGEGPGVIFIDQNGGGPGVRLRDPLP